MSLLKIKSYLVIHFFICRDHKSISFEVLSRKFHYRLLSRVSYRSSWTNHSLKNDLRWICSKNFKHYFYINDININLSLSIFIFFDDRNARENFCQSYRLFESKIKLLESTIWKSRYHFTIWTHFEPFDLLFYFDIWLKLF